MQRAAGGRRGSRALIIGVAVLALGCSGDDDGDLEGAATDAESSTTSETGGSGTSSTTTIAACPPVERSDIEGGLAEQEADVDGDGQPDVVQSFPTGSTGDPFTLLVDLAAGGGATLEIPGNGDFPVALLGAATLAPDEPDRVWVRVGAGASTTILGLYHLDGCELKAATFENGEPVQLPIGGTVGTASGAACGSEVDAEADLLVYEASYLSEDQYEIVTTEYRWEDGVLVPSPASAPTVSQSDLSRYGGFHCGDLTL